MRYQTSEKFDREFRALHKKFRSLGDDFEILKSLQLNVFHEMKTDNGSIFKVVGCCNDDFDSYVIKKIPCKSLKGRGSHSGLRITYILDKRNNEITFMEIYFKADKECEDKERLKAYIEQRQL